MNIHSEQFCNCFKPLSLQMAMSQLWDEVVEFFKKPSRDEFSDCAFALGRLLASLRGRLYVHIPFDSRHWAKIARRAQLYGCVRSERHLKDGKCPSF